MATTDKKFERNTWIADSGSSGHMVSHLEGFTKIKTKSFCTGLTGSGKSMTIQKTGIWKGIIKTSDGREMPVVLQDVDYVPKLMCNLLSTSQMQKNGWKVIGERDTFRIEKGNTNIVINKKIVSHKGQIFGIEITPRVEETEAYAMMALFQKLTYKQAHSILGHPGQQMVMATAKKNKWIIDPEGENDPFQSCLIGKAKREVINKERYNKSTIPGD